MNRAFLSITIVVVLVVACTTVWYMNSRTTAPVVSGGSTAAEPVDTQARQPIQPSVETTPPPTPAPAVRPRPRVVPADSVNGRDPVYRGAPGPTGMDRFFVHYGKTRKSAPAAATPAPQPAPAQ